MRSDVTRAGFKPECFDVVLCQAVSHHLPDDVVADLFSESARVLKPDGRLIFLDATKTDRATGRFLWRLDQGSSPRAAPHLRALLESCFEVDGWERFAMLHDYVLVVARPRSSVPSVPAAEAAPAVAAKSHGGAT
jgi:SAM-dependent methyltransferase